MLDEGSSWVRVVHDYSTDPTTKDADGVLPNVTQGVGNPQFERAVFSAKKGEIVGPVKTADGYYVFEVTKATPGKVAKLKDVKPSIEAILFQQRKQAALAKFGQDYQDRWKSETDCASGYVSPDCSQAKPQRNSTVPPGAIPAQPTTPQGAVPATSAQPQVPQQQQPQTQP
jgi:foldase protein PrsA